MTEDVRLRRISDGDWDGIVALEAGTYGDSELSEDRAALESRGRVSPDTCFVLARGRQVVGYALALPYPPFRYPDLSRPEVTACHSRNLHLHDLVVAEKLRGRGLAKRLLGRLTATAGRRSYERISLVAVGGADTFWSANGFHPHTEVALPRSYGSDAVYMSRAVPADMPEQTGPANDPLPGSPRKTK